MILYQIQPRIQVTPPEVEPSNFWESFFGVLFQLIDRISGSQSLFSFRKSLGDLLSTTILAQAWAHLSSFQSTAWKWDWETTREKQADTVTRQPNADTHANQVFNSKGRVSTKPIMTIVAHAPPTYMTTNRKEKTKHNTSKHDKAKGATRPCYSSNDNST